VSFAQTMKETRQRRVSTGEAAGTPRKSGKVSLSQGKKFERVRRGIIFTTIVGDGVLGVVDAGVDVFDG
jgi:hypothetical protein